ncbi:D-alanyl-lipoteichoic acid biosynthesis protein DltB [Ruminococcaceae bacterium BL-4]|nr:D-alanyl-lipoteichoic acid biosynthesis protein DltB [Ruminococcaceae bacterium BL-4]
MAYNSLAYLVVFLVPVFLLYTIVPKRYKWIVLLAASYGFYLMGSGFLVIFLLITTVSIYFCALSLDKVAKNAAAVRKTLPKEEKKAFRQKIDKKKRRIVLLTVLVNILILLVLKYYNFLGGAMDGLLASVGLPKIFPAISRQIQPLGISFYTLQAISYVMDVYHGKYTADRNFGKVALFLVFFPQIVEGPIGRFDLLADQLYEGHTFDWQRTISGMQLILWGLFQKVVIADRADILVGKVCGNFANYSGITVILTMLIYTLQIYTDFAGSIDIVMGSAQLFGVSLSKNFDRPFSSHTVNEFWRRWHITLGTWLRDYVFYPVSISKPIFSLGKFTRKHLNTFFAGLVPAIISLFCVWFTNGFWHGAGVKYILYGMYYYAITILGLLFEPVFRRFFEATKINRKGKGFQAFQVVRTFFLVNVGMLIFRANTLRSFRAMFVSMFSGFNPSVLTDGSLLSLGLDYKDLIILAVGTLLLWIVGRLHTKGHHLRDELAQKNSFLRWGLSMAMLFVIIMFGAYGYGYVAINPIYGNF